ncbi:MAG: hypothetical protein ACR2GA_03735 [Chloroflexota bacterium]
MGRTIDERWVLRTPEEMAEEVMVCWGERFLMVLDDLLHLPGEGPIIAEGAGLFPHLVAPLLGSPRSAVWLVGAPGFIEQVRSTRGMSVADADHIGDRARAFRNIIERDWSIAAQVQQQAEEGGLSVIEVNSQTVEQLPAIVERRLESWLTTIV